PRDRDPKLDAQPHAHDLASTPRSRVHARGPEASPPRRQRRHSVPAIVGPLPRHPVAGRTRQTWVRRESTNQQLSQRATTPPASTSQNNPHPRLTDAPAADETPRKLSGPFPKTSHSVGTRDFSRVPSHPTIS